MFKNFFYLEWKSFIRSASFKTNLLFKILMFLAALYFIAIFSFLGIGLFYLLKKFDLDPFLTVNTYLIYYVVMDLIVRFLLQKIPVMNIRPLLSFNIRKNKIVGYTLGKSIISFFNWVHIFFLLPFSIVLYREGFDPAALTGWFIGVFSLIFINNFLNILSANNTKLLYFLAGTLMALGAFQYFQAILLAGQSQFCRTREPLNRWWCPRWR